MADFFVLFYFILFFFFSELECVDFFLFLFLFLMADMANTETKKGETELIQRGVTPSVSPVLSNSATVAKEIVQPQVKGSQHSGATERVILVGCIAGILVPYLVYGMLQEQLFVFIYALPIQLLVTIAHNNDVNSGSQRFKAEGEVGEGRRFKFVSFSLAVQAAVNCALAAVIMLVWYGRVSSIPGKVLGLYGATSSVQMAAMFCSNRAVYYVDYPTHVVAKCCKPIPVLIFGLLFGRGLKNYSMSRILSVTITTAGVALFMRSSAMAKSDTKPSDYGEEWTFGLALLGGSLFFDGLTGFLQDMVMQNHYKKDSRIAERAPWEMMLLLNAFGTVLMLAVTIFTGEGVKAVQFCMEFPRAFWMVLASAFVSAVGQCFVFVTIARFDALMCSTVTTIRKFCSILLSVIWFKHPLTKTQWASVVFVFGGIGYELFQKGRKSTPREEQKSPVTAGEKDQKRS